MRRRSQGLLRRRAQELHRRALRDLGQGRIGEDEAGEVLHLEAFRHARAPRAR